MQRKAAKRKNRIVLYILMGVIIFSAGFIHFSSRSNAEDYSEEVQATESAPVERSNPSPMVLKSVHGSDNPTTGAVTAQPKETEPAQTQETTVETAPAAQEEVETETVETEVAEVEPEEENLLAVVSTEVIEVEPEEVYTEPEAEASNYSSTDTSSEYAWDGPVLNAYVGTVTGPSGKETYYNLDMSGIVSSIQNHTWLWNDIAPEYRDNVTGEYWIRDDGVKMLGDYIMVAANLDVHPRGTLVQTSLGMGVVVDTGGFASYNTTQLDIAVNW